MDASAFISLVVETDNNHLRAAEIAARLESEQTELVTSNMVIAEVLTVLGMRFNKNLAREFGERIMGEGIFITHPTALLFESAWNIWKKEPNKDVSFVDALSFAIIQEQDITAAFSFDKDFRNREFEVLH